MHRQVLRLTFLTFIMMAVVAIGSTGVQWSASPSLAGSGPGPFAYVANNSSGQVSVIDLTTEAEVTAIATGGSPYWVAISSNGATVAASLHNSTGVALIDATTNTLLGVVGGVGSEPEAVAVNSAGTRVYVADESGEELFVVDVASEMVTAGPIDLSATCSEPENMVISPDDAFLYITCAGFSNSNVIRVATAGFAITVVAGGLNDPHGLALNATGTRLYYTDGTDAFEWNTGTQTDTGTTYLACELYFGAVSPDGATLYCKMEFGDLRIYNVADGSLLASVATGGSAVALHADGSRAYVPTGSVVEVVDTAAMVDLSGDIPMSGSGGRGIAIGPAQAVSTPTPTETPTGAPQPTLQATSQATPQATAAAVALPDTGASGTGASGARAWPLFVLLGAGLSAIAGYAALRVRPRRL